MLKHFSSMKGHYFGRFIALITLDPGAYPQPHTFQAREYQTDVRKLMAIPVQDDDDEGGDDNFDMIDDDVDEDDDDGGGERYVPLLLLKLPEKSSCKI